MVEGLRHVAKRAEQFMQTWQKETDTLVVPLKSLPLTSPLIFSQTRSILRLWTKLIKRICSTVSKKKTLGLEDVAGADMNEINERNIISDELR